MPQFVRLQRRLFPLYFQGQALLMLLTAATYPPISLRGLVRDWPSLACLSIGALMSGINLFLYGPQTSVAMMERLRQGNQFSFLFLVPFFFFFFFSDPTSPTIFFFYPCPVFLSPVWFFFSSFHFLLKRKRQKKRERADPCPDSSSARLRLIYVLLLSAANTIAHCVFMRARESDVKDAAERTALNRRFKIAHAMSLHFNHIAVISTVVYGLIFGARIAPVFS
jgi:hypothetical protein